MPNSRPTAPNRRRLRLAGRRVKPRPGWNLGGHAASGLSNPRQPAVPATLDINLVEYYSAATLMGLLSAQTQEPDRAWAKDWSFRMGADMAAEARRRRRK